MSETADRKIGGDYLNGATVRVKEYLICRVVALLVVIDKIIALIVLVAKILHLCSVLLYFCELNNIIVAQFQRHGLLKILHSTKLVWHNILDILWVKGAILIVAKCYLLFRDCRETVHLQNGTIPHQ